MKRLRPALAALMALTAASTTPASAHSNDFRQRQQDRLIEQGRQDGTITWREGLKLRRQQAAIARVEREMAADGHLSRHERRVLHGYQDEARDEIARQSSDGWRRPWWLKRLGY